MREEQVEKAHKTWHTDADAAMDAMDMETNKMNMEVMKNNGCKSFMGELYSPPRIVQMATEFGLRGGFSLDLTTPGPDGYVWDFTKAECRARAWKLIKEKAPFLIIGSPPCTAFSSLQNFQRCKPGGDAKVDKAMEEAKVHIEFCMKIYRYQLRKGRYFLHEHPQTAKSWRLECVEELARSPLVYKATTPYVQVRNGVAR